MNKMDNNSITNSSHNVSEDPQQNSVDQQNNLDKTSGGNTKLQKNSKNIILAVIILCIIFGCGIKYGRFMDGKPLTPIAVAGEFIRVDGFEAAKQPDDIVVLIKGEVDLIGYFSVPKTTTLRELIDFVGVTGEGDVSDFDFSHSLVNGDEFYVKNKNNLADGEDWLKNQILAPENNANSKPEDEKLETVSSEELININTATLEELDTLPGIGESKAKAIIEYRNTNGRFIYKEDILGVKGIGDKLYENIADKICVE